MKFTERFFLVLGILCFCYYFVVISATGRNGAFAWFWLLCGGVCLGISLLSWLLRRKRKNFPKYIWLPFWSLFCCGMLYFGIIAGMVLRNAYFVEPKEADYLIVLGAEVQGSNPSKMLRQRINAAAEYLEKYPNAVVVASGGQGKRELVSEAEAIKTALVAKGISESRILTEAKSTNTVENIALSKKLMPGGEETVAIVSSEFHLFRAKKIAQKQGIEEVYGVGADSDPAIVFHYVVREVIAISKDFLLGNI